MQLKLNPYRNWSLQSCKWPENCNLEMRGALVWREIQQEQTLQAQQSKGIQIQRLLSWFSTAMDLSPSFRNYKRGFAGPLRSFESNALPLYLSSSLRPFVEQLVCRIRYYPVLQRRSGSRQWNSEFQSMRRKREIDLQLGGSVEQVYLDHGADRSSNVHEEESDKIQFYVF